MKIVPGLGGVRGGAMRPALPLPRLSPQHGATLRVAAAPSKIGHTAADEAIVLDLNYAQVSAPSLPKFPPHAGLLIFPWPSCNPSRIF
jgi:hypothetical protein